MNNPFDEITSRQSLMDAAGLSASAAHARLMEGYGPRLLQQADQIGLRSAAQDMIAEQLRKTISLDSAAVDAARAINENTARLLNRAVPSFDVMKDLGMRSGFDASRYVDQAMRSAYAIPDSMDYVRGLKKVQTDAFANLMQSVQKSQTDAASAFVREFQKTHTELVANLAGSAQQHQHELTADLMRGLNQLQLQAGGGMLASQMVAGFDANGLGRAIENVTKSLGLWIDPTKFGESQLLGLASSALRVHDEQVNKLFQAVDVDGLQAMAAEIGERLVDGFNDEDEPLTEARFRAAIEQAGLGTLKEKAQQQVSEALEQVLDRLADSAKSQHALVQGQQEQTEILRKILAAQRLKWYVIAVLALWQLSLTLVQTFGSPTYDRQLQQSDRLAASKARTQMSKLPSVTRSMMVVNAARLHLRSGPSTTQRIVATVGRSQWVRLIKTKNQWVLVSWVDPDATGASYTGWVKAQYVHSVEVEAVRMFLSDMRVDMPAAGAEEPMGNDEADAD